MESGYTGKPVGLPPKQGLYDPQFEHDACGVGFVVNIKGKKSNSILREALTVLLNLTHRGATGAEPTTGDGAGILFQMPHKFFQKVCAEDGIDLPAPGEYGVGMLFLPQDESRRLACEQKVNEIIAAEGQELLGWRTVPINNSGLGKSALLAEPAIRQVFIKRNPNIADPMAFERKLYVIRKLAKAAIRDSGEFAGGKAFYFTSLSYKTIIYKGMLMSEQLPEYYPDLSDPDIETALAIVHSRFSTNTFPSWDRAHPYRYIIHNGEINTVRGNINWMFARQSTFESSLFGDDLPKVLPVIDNDTSDSGMFDNALEFLTLSGWPIHQAMMMMIPEPWSNHESMSDEKKAFYEYHSALMEPWDGPASIGFTDGTMVGAVLDRNGLRPSRYYVTKDDRVIMASEVGVLDVPPENVLYKGRLEPGRMFLVDMDEGRIVGDKELKEKMSTEKPYGEWLEKYRLKLEDRRNSNSSPWTRTVW